MGIYDDKTLLVIFGITGDLSTRKLLPALSNIIDSPNSPSLEVLGVSRRKVDVGELVMGATNNQALVSKTSLLSIDMAEINDYKLLSKAIKSSKAGQTLIYLSVPPGAAAQIVDMLGESGLNTPNIRLLFEKPFGFDLASAQDFIERTSRYFDESQIYRIDHYMAKEVSFELLRLRRNTESRHHHWGAESIESVTIVASEKIGIEGRAQFYEQTGALRDVVQGHLMQLLALVLMDHPRIDDSLPERRLQALRHLKIADPAKAVRGQYEGYQEDAANEGSLVETFVALELESDDDNWKGVPLRLVTGKALDEKRSYIEIKYRDGKVDVFAEDDLRAGLDAYERILLEAISGSEELFTSSEEVIRSWEVLSELQQSWQMNNRQPAIYKKGANYTEVFSNK